MQWCQPVWDGIDDPDPDADNPARSNEFAFINMKYEDLWVRGLNMHMTSLHQASGPYYGIFAETLPWPRVNNHHQGVDLYSGPNGNNVVFAVHAGKLKSHHGYGYGNRAYILLGGIGEPCFHYAHLQDMVSKKDWILTGEIVGNSGRTYEKNGQAYVPNQYPSHLHLEFIMSAGNTTPAISGTKVVFSEINNINPPANATYSTPTGANAFLFQGNQLPLFLPCQCHYGSEQAVSQCRVGNNNHTEYKTCYAIARFPYENNLLLSYIPYMISENLYPENSLKRFICPHILGSQASLKVQLQAKVKYLCVNKNYFNSSIFPYNNTELAVFKALFTANSNNMAVDGDIGNGTKSIIRSIVRAHYYCDNQDLEENERILADSDSRISNEKISAFVNMYVESEDIPSSDDYNIIRDFYNWFVDDSRVDFSDICWNAPV